MTHWRQDYMYKTNMNFISLTKDVFIEMCDYHFEIVLQMASKENYVSCYQTSNNSFLDLVLEIWTHKIDTVIQQEKLFTSIFIRVPIYKNTF